MKVSILRKKKENEGEYFEKKILKMKMSILKKKILKMKVRILKKKMKMKGEYFEKKKKY